VQLIEKVKRQPVYSDLTDEIGSGDAGNSVLAPYSLSICRTTFSSRRSSVTAPAQNLPTDFGFVIDVHGTSRKSLTWCRSRASSFTITWMEISRLSQPFERKRMEVDEQPA
jgi:hypothetical protein